MHQGDANDGLRSAVRATGRPGGGRAAGGVARAHLLRAPRVPRVRRARNKAALRRRRRRARIPLRAPHPRQGAQLPPRGLHQLHVSYFFFTMYRMEIDTVDNKIQNIDAILYKKI